MAQAARKDERLETPAQSRRRTSGLAIREFPIDLTREKGQSKFQLAPSAMFDASLEDLIWTVDTNKDYRIVQFRVYTRP